MQHIIDEIRENFDDFIEDEDRPVMIIEVAADDSLLLLKTLDMIEEDEESMDVFVTYLDDFGETREYVDELFDNQKEQLASVNEELEKRGDPLLELFPDDLHKRTLTNHERLVGIAKHVRKIVEPERLVVWTFFPLSEAENSESFVNLVRYLAEEILEGRIGRTKLIVRDTSDQQLRSRLEPFAKSTVIYEPKVDLASIFQKIEEQSKNKDAPPDERAQNIMLLAGVDIAEKRFDSALAKNESVLKFFTKTKQKEKESVVHNSIGDIHYLKGDFPTAQKSYESAISISIDEKSQPLVIYQSINLGNSLFMQNKFDEALIYYESAEKLSAINQIVMQRVQALERKGDTKRAQGELDEAIVAWEKAVDVCRENAYKIGMVGVLEKLDAAFEEKGDSPRRQKNAKELREVKKEIEAVEPAILEKAG